MSGRFDIVTYVNNPIGICMRKPTEGEELKMVDKYIVSFQKSVLKRFANKNYIVFIEPWINDSYPDILIVEYDTDRLKTWNCYRQKFSIQDLKILSFLISCDNNDLKTISAILGFKISHIEKSIIKLQKAELVDADLNVYLKDFYCVKNVMCVEAKVRNFYPAIDQAYKHTVYANRSYALSKNYRLSPNLKKYISCRGVGVINSETNKIDFRAKYNKTRHSVVNLIINEWISKYCFLK